MERSGVPNRRSCADRGVDTAINIAHRHALAELCFEQPLAQLQQQLQEFPYDYSRNPVVLTKAHLKDAL